jgi:hypothetical protein
MRRGHIPAAILLTAAILNSCSLLEEPAPEGSAAPPTTAATTSPAAPPTTPTAAPAPTLPPPPPGDICDSFAEPIVTGTIGNPEITEASGLAASRRYPGVLWTHNDSGGGAEIFAVDTTGADLATFAVDALAFDWEDMAIGPGPQPGTDYLYLGDIGDNLRFRPSIIIYRIAEPDPAVPATTIGDVATIRLTYPDSLQDAEAMFVDPITGDLVIVTKRGAGEPAGIYRAPASQLSDGAQVELIAVAELPLEAGAFVTAADIDSSGAVVALRGYNQVWMWIRTDLDFTDTFQTPPCRAPSTAEIQGEAISFAPTGFSYYTVSEGTSPDINFVENRP